MAITGINTLDGKQIIAAGASSAISAQQALQTSGGNSLQGLYDFVYNNSGSWTGGGGGGGGVVTATGGTTTYVQTINNLNISATNAGSALSATDAYNLTNTAIKVASATSANAALAANTATYASNGVSLTDIYNSACSGYAASAYLKTSVAVKVVATSAQATGSNILYIVTGS